MTAISEAKKDLVKLKMIFLLIFLCQQHGFEKISAQVESLNEILSLSSEILRSESIYLFLFCDGTLIDDNDYLNTLDSGSELLACTTNQKEKFLTYFVLKRYCKNKDINNA